MLRDIIFPSEKSTWNLTDSDYRLLYTFMSQRPSESQYPDYSKDSIPDSYCKFLLFGSIDEIPKHIRIFNKIGQAYGFLIDNAYILDFENNIEFLLSASILVNENQIYNDGQYEYETLGYPFMRKLGQTIYELELKRKRKYEPDLSTFQLNYD